MIDHVYKHKESKDRHIVYFSKLKNYYRAVFKKAVNKLGEEEVYLLSLVRSPDKL